MHVTRAGVRRKGRGGADYLYKTELGLIISGLDSGYPSMHLTRLSTNSTRSLWMGCLKNLAWCIKLRCEREC